MNISERLKYIRQKTGLSQKKFADLLDEKLSRINSIETGKQIKFPYDLAEKILIKIPEQYYNFKWITTGKGEPHLEKTLSIKDKILQDKAKEIAEKLSDNTTDTEFNLIIDCLKEKKELTIMLLKKLQEHEKVVKRFLLDN